MTTIKKIYGSHEDVELQVVCPECLRHIIIDEDQAFCHLCLREIEQLNIAAWGEYLMAISPGGCCPQCKSKTGIKIPNGDPVYCEDCGWPEDNRGNSQGVVEGGE